MQATQEVNQPGGISAPVHGNLEERLSLLEDRLAEVEERLAFRNRTASPPNVKKGWRWFVGIYADYPDFDEVIRIGEEWRNADRPVV